MITEFYTKALPSEGVYCIATIDPETKMTRHHFVESLQDIEPKVNELLMKPTNIFVALSSFDGYSRKGEHAKLVRSFFVDLDVGEGKGYTSKQEAIDALNKFVDDNNLPPPVKVDSGTGIHSYWFMDRDIPIDEWKPYAEKFKDFCITNGLRIDPVVTADITRILRCPDTLNQKTTPASPTKVLDEVFPVYVFDEFKEFLGDAEPSLSDILQSTTKGLTEDQRKMLKLDNFGSDFHKIEQVSMQGTGCAQIKWIIDNAATLPEPIWYAGLSIAEHCEDREYAIRRMSEGYEGYVPEVADAKARQANGKPHSCDAFDSVNPGICTGCPHRNKITNPLALGKVFKAASEDQPAAVQPEPEVSSQSTTTQVAQVNPLLPERRGLTFLPDELYPFVYGKQGGIYCMPPPKYDEDGVPIPGEPVLVSLYDLYPVKRIFSPADGECLLMRAVLPRDPEREFLLPLRCVYAVEDLKKIISSQGVLFNSDAKGAQFLMNYIIKWGHYLVTKNSAEIMRMQMGWTENKESFVVGETEYTRDGKELNAPTSPLCKGIAKHLVPKGSYAVWQEAANKLARDSLELHAFTLLSGFGSIMMDYTSTSGVTISLVGEPGAAKTGALYASLSVWGNPKDLSVLDATANGMTGRYLALHNIPFGLDEVGNINPKDLSQLIHKISQGKSKIRMQASVNAERDHEMSASLIAVFTANHSMYDKLTTLKKDPSGEVARLIEFAIRKPQAFLDEPTLGKEIFETFRHNYGWAGREFVKKLYEISDAEIQAKMDKWITRFRKDFTEDTAYRFYENLIAAVMTAGEIAVAAGIVKYDLDKIYRRIVGEMVAIRDNVVKINSVDYESLIGEFINMHQRGILAFKEGKISMEPQAPLVIRAELDTQQIYISKPEFRKHLADNMVSSREFMFQMKQAGVEIREVRKRMGTGWKDATATVNVETYAINTGKLSTKAFGGSSELA